MALLAVVLLLTIALAALYHLKTRHFKFWKNAGIRTLNSPTLRGAIKGTFLGAPLDLYTFAPEEPYIGIIRLNSLAVSIRDPDIIRSVLSKDFSSFHDRGSQFDEDRDPLSANLFNLEGQQWRILRAKLTPTFTSGKLRGMFPLMKYCVDQMINILLLETEKSELVDLTNVFSRCTTDVILSCAFGLKGNSLKDPDDIYTKMVKSSFQASLVRKYEHILFVLFPSLQKVVPLRPNRKEVNDFFVNTLSSTVKEREQSGAKRNDFLDLLMEIKKNGYLADGHKDTDAMDSSMEFTDKLMAAQAFVFFIAGSETSSATSSFAAIEIANNPSIQKKLQAEVDRAIELHGGLTYQAVLSMTYLDQLVSETLRKYPPAVALIRKVTRPYTMPDGRVTLPVGMRLYIHVHGLHMDPKYYPDPERFDPERFSPEVKRDRHKYVYLPFGEGPRICIGMRFGLLQVKLGIAALVSQFELRPRPGVPYPPLKSKKSLVSALDDGAVLISKRVKTKS